MTSSMNAIDTNVWIYLYSEDIGEGTVAGLRIVNPFARRTVDKP